VFFHGQIADPLSLISQWDVGLLPTYFAAESLPNTIIEYMYSQIPTIATGVAEIPKMLTEENKSAGIVIPLNSSGKVDVMEIAKAMQRYLDDTQLWQEHKINAEILYVRFDINTCIDEYINFFKSTITYN
jgi:glycosyltransferase involved in cell wall biosynthesis